MTLEIEKYKIEITLESDYNQNSVDNITHYDKKYLAESDYPLRAKIGIKILENDNKLNSAIIVADGGVSGLHNTSQIIQHNHIFICCGDSIFCLDLPTLNLIWKTKVDYATAFEIYEVDGGFIIHGELEISRIDNNGIIIWKRGGEDIFVTQNGHNDFEIMDNFIQVTDWGNKIYKWDFNGNDVG